MAYPATKRYSYLGQFGILIGLIGGGLIFGQVIALIPLFLKTGGSLIGSNSREVIDKLFVPENAGVLRLVQFLSTFFLFFLPAFFYARICHKKPLTHLGYKESVNMQQAGLAIVIMFVCLPLVGALTELTEKLPFSKATFEKFRLAEEEYNKQVSIIGRMNNFGDYILSLFMLAILPALFEETFFRGGVQNLLSRWIKMPILAIIITSIVFSAVHGSYLGFLSRFVLGFVLGWMYYRTGNLWLSIIGHAFNNGFAITVLYVMKLKNPNMDISKADPEFPIWSGLASIVVLYGLYILFEKVNKYQINQPGRELVMQIENPNQPTWLSQTGETTHTTPNGI